MCIRERFLFTLIFLWQNVFGQISFTTEIARDSMQLGDHNTYKLKIVHSPDIKIQAIDLNPIQTSLVDAAAKQDTSIANNSEKKEALETQLTQQGISNELMEIIDWGVWQSPGKEMRISGGENNWKSENIGEQILKANELKFTYWEEGRHVVFSPIIQYQQNGTTQIVTAPEVAVMVGSPLGNSQVATDTTQAQIDPIKDIIEEPLDIWSDILIPFGGRLLILLALLGLIYFLIKKSEQRKKMELAPKPVVIRPAHDIALEKLDVLENAELWQNGNVKEYQSQLTLIIREYLENRYEINALENTTVEIKKDLKKLALDDTLQSELQNILQVADLVKFAKAKPGASVHEEFMEKAKNFVLKTKKEIIIVELSLIHI